MQRAAEKLKMNETLAIFSDEHGHIWMYWQQMLAPHRFNTSLDKTSHQMDKLILIKKTDEGVNVRQIPSFFK